MLKIKTSRCTSDNNNETNDNDNEDSDNKDNDNEDNDNEDNDNEDNENETKDNEDKEQQRRQRQDKDQKESLLLGRQGSFALLRCLFYIHTTYSKICVLKAYLQKTLQTINL